MRATRLPSLTPLLLALALVLASPAGAIMLLGVLTPDGDGYLPTLDELRIPEAWEVVHTETVDGGFMTSARATRYYFADLDPVDGVSTVKDIARAAGFSDPPRPTVRENCPSNNGGLPTDCIVEAIRALPSDDKHVEVMWIHLYRRGSPFTVGSGDERKLISDPDRALIRITVRVMPLTFFGPVTAAPSLGS
jgi:hypothetical protein